MKTCWRILRRSPLPTCCVSFLDLTRSMMHSGTGYPQTERSSQSSELMLFKKTLGPYFTPEDSSSETRTPTTVCSNLAHTTAQEDSKMMIRKQQLRTDRERYLFDNEFLVGICKNMNYDITQKYTQIYECCIV